MILEEAEVSEGGCLLHDREFAMMDEDGGIVNGKRNHLVHRLRSSVDFNNETISFRLQDEESWNTYNLPDTASIEKFLSAYFGMNIIFVQNKTGRLLDIPDISGVTILSSSSLQTVSKWYEHLDVSETRQRFRATLEVEGVDAFWEDHLFSGEGRGIEFRLGAVKMFGMSPRARCVVPTRDSQTGEVTHAFPKIFSKHRALSLPQWSTLNDYGHHYYLTVNCYIPGTEKGKKIRTGDGLEIIGEKIFIE